MPVYRTPDGKIVEEKTQVQRGKTPASEAPTQLDDTTTGAGGASPPRPSRYTDETVVDDQSLGRESSPAPEAQPATPEASGGQGGPLNPTRLAGVGSNAVRAADAVEQVSDPVVGWIVVVDGPGRGGFAPIGVGRNSVGRAATERVTLNFGDEGISREGHMFVTYDHRGRQFFVQPGLQGTNLTYLDDEALNETRPLESGQTLTLSETIVRFVAFCDESFDWSDA